MHTSSISKFRTAFPLNPLVTELLYVRKGIFVVRASTETPIATAIASANTAHEAEDLAIERLLERFMAFEQKVEGDPLPTIPDSELFDKEEDETKPHYRSTIERCLELADPTHLIAEESDPQPNTLSDADQSDVNDMEKVQSLSPVKNTPSGFSFGVTTQSQKPETDTALEPQKATETVEPPASENLPTEENTLAPLGGIMGEMFKGIVEQQEVAPEPEPKKTRKRKPKSTEMEETTIPPSEPDSTTVLPLIPQAQPSVAIQSSLLPKSPAPEVELLDFAEVIADTNRELKRLEWTNEQGKNYLLQTYSKRSRQLLTDEELIEFFAYLKSLPSP